MREIFDVLKRTYPKTALLFFISICLLFQSLVIARPVRDNQARKAAEGWLRRDSKPFQKAMGKADRVQTCLDDSGQVIFYVVYLQPEGFVVISADDELEPVIAFSSEGTIDPYDDSTLSILLRQDMKSREEHLHLFKAKSRRKHAGRWQQFEKYAEASVPVIKSSISSVSDLRVPPLLSSTWGQSTVSGLTTYNYYIPNNYVCGCVATAMAQLMRYHEYPTTGIGVHPYTIDVDGVDRTASTRGGNGSGGAYSWSDMPVTPNSSITLAERQQIGALCYDAGLSVNMSYDSSSSGAHMSKVDGALTGLFMYSDAAYAVEYDWNTHTWLSLETRGLNQMVNPGLDAGLPSLLGVVGDGGHAIVVDGYGYQSGTLYHHLNLGWSGSSNAWYALPDIGTGYHFDTVDECIYNIQPAGSGEIISGRILDEFGQPLEGVTVQALWSYAVAAQDTTDIRGIYGLAGLDSNKSYQIIPQKDGYAFTNQTVSVTESTCDRSWWTSTCGNVWQTNFTGTSLAGSPPTAYDSEVLISQAASVLIPLQADDEGLPNPPGALTWLINSLPEHGRLVDPNVGPITEVPYILLDPDHQVSYQPCGAYLSGLDTFTFSVDDGGISPDGGLSNTAAVTVQIQLMQETEVPIYPANIFTAYPLMAAYKAVRQQVIYPASEVGSARMLTQLDLEVDTVPGQVLENWTIRIKYTDRDVYTRSNREFDSTGWTLVYQADQVFTEGLNTFSFQTPFEYNGTDNLLIDFSFFNSTASTSGTVGSVNMGTSRTLYQRSNTLDTSPLGWTLADFSYLAYLETRIPKLKLWGYDETGIMILEADFNSDCRIDLDDLELMMLSWLMEQGDPNYDEACDISEVDDNRINLADLAVLAGQWTRDGFAE